jgi:hypothetical protein
MTSSEDDAEDDTETPVVLRRKRVFLPTEEDMLAIRAALLVTKTCCTFPNRIAARECVVEKKPWKACCGRSRCCDAYSTEDVAALRQYYFSLSKHDRRGFVQARHQRQQVRGRRVTQKGLFLLEGPGRVEDKFASRGTLLPPDLEGMTRCCTTWLAWCLDVAPKTLRANAVERDGLHAQGRARRKEKHVEDWLWACRGRYLVMPHVEGAQKDTVTVVPFRSHIAMHCSYIIESELARGTGRFEKGEDRYENDEPTDDSEAETADDEYESEASAGDGDDDEEADDLGHGCKADRCRSSRRCRCHDLDSSSESGEEDGSAFRDPCQPPDLVISSSDEGDDEGKDEGEDEEEEEPEPEKRRRRKKQKYRYGNVLLGHADKHKVDPSLPSLAHFNRIWRLNDELRKYLVVRKYMPFAKCNWCFRYRTEGYHTKDRKKAREARRQHRRHLQEQHRNRAAVEAKRDLARRQPDECLVIGIDGADNGKNDLPHFEEVTKQVSGSHGATIHLTGVLPEGGLGGRPLVYVGVDNVKQGHNVTIQVGTHMHVRGARRSIIVQQVSADFALVVYAGHLGDRRGRP